MGYNGELWWGVGHGKQTNGQTAAFADGWLAGWAVWLNGWLSSQFGRLLVAWLTQSINDYITTLICTTEFKSASVSSCVCACFVYKPIDAMSEKPNVKVTECLLCGVE